uniref:Uncharacterized protein n=1 Tax=Amphora coffeiformis TaxID=265554 RepID=A0A7S3L102_9STRA|eukprot:scaffold4510_cov183-Amphora_coffeaeformis.AAC.34
MEEGHFLPDHDKGWGVLSLAGWINLWILVGAVSQLGYLFICGTNSKLFTSSNDNRLTCKTASLDVVVVWILLLPLFGMKFSLDRQHSQGDPLLKLVAFFLVGVLVEAVFYKNGFLPKTVGKMCWPPRRPRIRDLHHTTATTSGNRNNNHGMSSSSQATSSGRGETFLLTWRFSFFLLWSGSNCILTYCLHLRDYNYEYLGPMRITKLPSLHKMPYLYTFDDEYNIFPCLHELPVESRHHLSQPNMQVRVDLEWGKQWGCASPEEKDSWNTNWPTYPQCTRFICTTTTTTTTTETALSSGNSCPCYPTEEEARKASWECISSQFVFSRIRSNETFDPMQAPWEDPSWPSLVRYGKCGHGGQSMDIGFVQERMFDGKRQRNYGLVCVSLACVIIGWIRFHSEQDEDEPAHVVAARALLTRLSSVRRGNDGTTIYIGERVNQRVEKEHLALTEIGNGQVADPEEATHLLHA